jgi:hypothetical protein
MHTAAFKGRPEAARTSRNARFQQAAAKRTPVLGQAAMEESPSRMSE